VSETVLTAIIGALALVVVALITVTIPLLISGRKHTMRAAQSAAEVNESVTNGHEQNYRAEGDERHALYLAKFGELAAVVALIQQRLGIVEHTIPARSKPRNYAPEENDIE